jgi:hypothetical protein
MLKDNPVIKKCSNLPSTRLLSWRGLLGVQVHAGDSASVEFRFVRHVRRTELQKSLEQTWTLGRKEDMTEKSCNAAT